MMETQPVWSPKYMLEKQMTVPTANPTRTPRAVKLRPGTTLDAILPVSKGASFPESACCRCEATIVIDVELGGFRVVDEWARLVTNLSMA